VFVAFRFWPHFVLPLSFAAILKPTQWYKHIIITQYF
jgi:hypothetical protein